MIRCVALLLACWLLPAWGWSQSAWEPVATPTRVVITPNPVSDIARIQLPESVMGSVHLVLLDVMGRPVLEAWNGPLTSSREILFRRGSLPAGVYLLRVQYSGGELMARVLIGP